MSIATKKFTLAEYLAYDDGTDTQYELVDGDLVAMSLGTGKHGAIIDYINDQFKAEIKRCHLPWTSKDLRIGIRSPRGTRWDTSRIPDIMVLSIELWQSLQSREAVIDLNDPRPILVVEVVSESTKSTDYRAKQPEYAVLDIPEYWIVDPLAAVVIICTLIEGMYEATEFHNSDRLLSSTFPDLTLTAAQVLQA